MRVHLLARTFLFATLVLAGMPLVGALGSDVAAAPPSTYVVEFVSTAADGVDMNDAGDVVGTSRLDTGCGSDCLWETSRVARSG